MEQLYSFLNDSIQSQKPQNPSLFSIAGKGSIVVSKHLTLNYVPNLSCNLLSIRKLTKELNAVSCLLFVNFRTYVWEDKWQCFHSNKLLGAWVLLITTYVWQLNDGPLLGWPYVAQTDLTNRIKCISSTSGL